MLKRQSIFKAAKAPDIIPGEMSDMDINRISLVRKGANKQKIQIYKEDETDEQEEPDEKGLMAILKSYFQGNTRKADEAVAPAAKKASKKTFSSMMAVNDITENMWRANDTLRSVMRDIINNEEITDKKAALLQAVDEYSAYMKNKVNVSTIAKGDSFFDVPEVVIEKAGKKVSSKNLETLKAALRALNAVISEAEPEPEGQKTETGKEENEEESEVKKEELTEVMKQALEQALEPINERLDKIEKADSKAEPGSGETAVEKEAGELAEILKSAVGEALKPISDRLEKVEKSRGMARSQEGEEDPARVEKGADIFDGFFVSE